MSDYDDLTKDISALRVAYSEFMSSSDTNNSKLQDYATQFLWHCLQLQKRRIDKFGVTLELEANRREYSKESHSVRSSRYFDGRYNVQNVSEEIYATRTLRHGNRELTRN